MSTMAPSHITIDDQGVARIDGTRMKVIHIAKQRVRDGSTPEEIQSAFPHLSLSQVYAALAYYYEHQDALDAQMQKDVQEYEQLLAEARASGSPSRDKIRDLRLRP
jgi:uncharacterized protein (DUF433 family)